ncbi:MAG TPA: phosphate signaling complex protein PhoU [Methanocellaceae archaeon]|jgi:phosphate transport system protein
MASEAISLDSLISSVKEKTITMMELAGRSVTDSVRSLGDRDTDLAKKVLGSDAAIDRLESEIESTCVDILAGSLSGKRLRFVAATYKIVSDLERIGDYSVGIANVTLAVANKPVTRDSLEITRMAATAECMLKACEGAYAGREPLMIERVFGDDVKIDELYNDIFVKALASALEEPGTITNLIYLTIASRALERIGDHITNIAERLEFIDTGELRRRDIPMHVPRYPGE